MSNHSTSTWLDLDLSDRRVQILKAAEELFAEHSYRSTEVADIAALAGMSKATIYRYFTSKDEILIQIVDENFKYIRDLVVMRLLTGTEPPLERFKCAALDVANHLEQNKSFVLVLIKDAGECMEEIQKMHHNIMNANTKIADPLFASLKKDGSLPDMEAAELLKIVSDICIGATYSWALSNTGTLASNVEFYFKLIFRQTQ